MLKVLLVTHYYPNHKGGVEVVAGELAGRLARRGVEILWAASGMPPSGLTCQVNYLPMRSWDISEAATGFAYPVWSPGSLLRLASAANRCDLVHIHENLYLGNLVAFAAARMFVRPVVVSQHTGSIPLSPGTPLAQRIISPLLGLAHRTITRTVLGGSCRSIFTNDALRRYYGRFVGFRRDPLVIVNGVDGEVFRPAGEPTRWRLKQALGCDRWRRMMLFVGRFIEKKGVKLLRELAKVFDQDLWVLVGWGHIDPSRWRLPNVRCVPPLNHCELAAYYQAADLLLLPSSVEGGAPPLVVQEAMSCGTPVVVTPEIADQYPGLRDVAYVCPRDPYQITGLLKSAIGSLHRATVASFAQQHFPGWEECADRYYNLYLSLSEEFRSQPHLRSGHR